jgi:hypothetical protein
LSRYCELLGLNRTGVYYTPRPIPEQNLRLMRRIDELHLEHPAPRHDLDARHGHRRAISPATNQRSKSVGDDQVLEFKKADLLAFLHSHRLAIVASVSATGSPQAALVGVAVTNELEVIFDTVSTSRKHANLTHDARAAVTWSGPGEKTVQYEGLAKPVSPIASEDENYRKVYYDAWSDGRNRQSWPNIVYWRIEPIWARYVDYDSSPSSVEFCWQK